MGNGNGGNRDLETLTGDKNEKKIYWALQRGLVGHEKEPLEDLQHSQV